jgi:WD40 repeat protein
MQAVAALPDGHPIGVGKDRTLGLSDLDTGEHPVLREKYTGLVSGGRGGTIRLLDLDAGEHPVLRKKHTGLVSGGEDGTIRLWNLDVGEHEVLKRRHFHRYPNYKLL